MAKPCGELLRTPSATCSLPTPRQPIRQSRTPRPGSNAPSVTQQVRAGLRPQPPRPQAHRLGPDDRRPGLPHASPASGSSEARPQLLTLQWLSSHLESNPRHCKPSPLWSLPALLPLLHHLLGQHRLTLASPTAAPQPGWLSFQAILPLQLIDVPSHMSPPL